MSHQLIRRRAAARSSDGELRLNAVVSGRAGLAVLIEGERLSLLRASAPDAPEPLCADDLPGILLCCTDLTFLTDTFPDEVARELEVAADREDALYLTLCTLDPTLSTIARVEAAAACSPLFADGRVWDHVASLLHGRPLPPSADPESAIQIAETAGASVLRELVTQLAERQAAVREVWSTWESLPEEVFQSGEDRRSLYASFVREGIVRAFVIRVSAGLDTATGLWRRMDLWRELVQSSTSGAEPGRVAHHSVERHLSRRVEVESAYLFHLATRDERAVFAVEARDRKEMRQIRELFDMVGQLAEVVAISHGALMTYAVQVEGDASLFSKVEWLLKTQFTFSVVQRDFSETTLRLVSALCEESQSNFEELPTCGICGQLDPLPTRVSVRLAGAREPEHVEYCARCTERYARDEVSSWVRSLIERDERGYHVTPKTPVTLCPVLTEEPPWSADSEERRAAG